MIKYDFDIVYAKDRAAYVNKEIQKEKRKLSPRQWEQLANYILFGKDEDGTSAVDRKEIEIGTKYGSYKKRKTESLDALLENPTFDEAVLVPPGQKSVVKNVKPTFNREEEGDIPGIQGLWREIDLLDHKLKVFKGQEKPKPGEKVISAVTAYNLKHLLIELRREQYTLRDVFKPTISRHTPEKKHNGRMFIDWNGEDCKYKVAPLGINPGNRWKINDNGTLSGIPQGIEVREPGPNTIDFRNPDHVYQLLEFYDDLESYCAGYPDAPLHDLLDALDFYIGMCDFDEIREKIIEKKKHKVSNVEIAELVNRKFKKSYNSNYISTIFKREICTKIATAASLHADMWANRDNPDAWKVCSCCGKKKLMDTREYSKKARSKDGFNTFCKECEKTKRLIRNGQLAPKA